MSSSMQVDGIIEDLGGCGLYQWILAMIIHAGKTGVSWTMLTMTFAGQNPGFWCRANLNNDHNNNNSTILDYETNETLKDSCKPTNWTACTDHRFDDSMKTIVSDFNLVCDSAWIVATITTIQMAGVLIGCFVAGHMGDTIGRRPTYYISLFLIALFNVTAMFSPSWQVYAIFMFGLGLGTGSYISVQYMIILEFVDAKWRARVVAFPSWPLEASLFALVAWGFKDWKYIHLSSAVAIVPFLLTFRFVPESARWLLTKKKFKSFESVIGKIASFNKKPVPNLDKVIASASETETGDKLEKKNYSAIDVFRQSPLITVVLFFIWMSMSFSYYGITFGVKNLSGDLYLNLFMMNIIEAPIQASLMFFANRFGRKKTCMAAFMLSGLCGIFVGVLVYIDVPNKGVLTNVFALTSKFLLGLGWSSMIIFTSEVYPTVVRSIAGGLHNTAARVGSMVAPQVVFLNDSIPGLLFFMAGSLLIVSSLLCIIFPETKDLVLQDNFTKSKNTVGVFTTSINDGEKEKAEYSTKT